MRKPVLFRVTNNLKVGGVQRRLRALLPLLAEDYDVHVVTYKDKGVFFDELAVLGVRTHFLPRKGHWDPLAIVRLARLFREHKADIVHTHSFGGNIFGILAAWLAKIPVRIGQVHSRGQHWYGATRFRRWKQCKEEAAVMGLMAHHVVCVSEETRAYYHQMTRLPLDKISVLHNGLDKLASMGTMALEEFHLPHDKPLIGFVGRLTAGKGLNFFLHFAAKALQECPGRFHFVIIGGGDQAPHKKLAGLLNIEAEVTFTGEMKDMHAAYSALDALLFTSGPAHEGMPGVVLEACSYGLPILARQSEPLREIHSYYNRINFLNESMSPALQLEQTLALPPADQVEFRNEFSIEAMRDRTLDLYARLTKLARQ
ncbi:glycosyltransferase [Desulfomicrobium escambiense]|uniref:glycosyltransferase n=1 Tax=Desulfomicrobium escambiense TaxID=29503 RepID=UPI00042A4E03|nr:glycosyltransferase [Desulfomicrobium escambiense]